MIYLPVEFSNNEISRLGGWFRENVAENIFMEIEIDSSVVSGCAFVWNSIYYDFSFSGSIKRKKKEIINMINTYNGDK